jgi:hypothetical protein
VRYQAPGSLNGRGTNPRADHPRLAPLWNPKASMAWSNVVAKPSDAPKRCSLRRRQIQFVIRFQPTAFHHLPPRVAPCIRHPGRTPMFCALLGSIGLFFALKCHERGYKSRYSISEISTSAVPPNSKRSMGLSRKRRFNSPVRGELKRMKRGLGCHLFGLGTEKRHV